MGNMFTVVLLILAAIFRGIQSGNVEIFKSNVTYQFPECQADLFKILEGVSKGEMWALKSRFNHFTLSPLISGRIF